MVTQIMLHTNEGKCVFSGGKIRFVTPLDLIKGLNKNKQQRLFPTCSPIPDLPSNIRTTGFSLAVNWTLGSPAATVLYIYRRG